MFTVMIISSDEIKKQLKGYHPKKAEVYHRQSARLADKKFEQALKEYQNSQVILMNGGSASGKTEFVRSYLDDFKSIVFDGTLSTIEGAKIKIKKILKYKKDLSVYSVFPDNLLQAFVAFLHRDRQFSDNHFYRTHSGARKTLLWITNNYPQVKIRIFESSYSKQEEMIFKEMIFKDKEERVKFLENNQYTEKAIIDIIKQRL